MKKSLISQINWQKCNGLIPAIIQNAKNNQVLMLGYMNKQALRKTLKQKRVWFYSRSKKRLWMKGEISKNTLKFVSAALDCDCDALLIQALPKGPTCHTNKPSCFGDDVAADNIFSELFAVIEDRKRNLPKNSYTTALFRAGLNKICAKIAEESAEVIKAAKKESKKRLIEESVDVLYHLFVLLAQKNADFGALVKELARRRK